MENISYDLLKTFVVYARSKNMVRAAKELKISQPAVTFQLKKLDEALPVSPFVEKTTKKKLSEFGRRLFNSLDKRFDDIEGDLRKITSELVKPEHRVYKLGARKEVLSRILPKIKIKGRLEAISLNDEEIISALNEGTVDIGITFEDLKMDNFEKMSLFSDKAKFCIHEKFLGNETLTLSKIKKMEFLKRVPVIAYNSNYPYLKEWLEAIDGNINDLEFLCIYEDWNDIMSLVESGQGFSILPSEIKSYSKKVITREIPKNIISEKRFFTYFSKNIERKSIEDMFCHYV